MRLLWSIYLTLALFAVRCGAEEDEGEYYTKYFETCADSDIEIEDVSLLCDSPGAYYYGNGKYRDSHTCMLGDKGKISVYFYVGEELEGTEPYVTIKVTDDFNSDAEEMYFYQDELMCSIGNLKAQGGQACPSPGYYYITGSNYLGDKDGSGNPFDAKVNVGFRSDPSMAYFDLGGANTELCKGDFIGKYSYGRMRKQVANAIASFLVTWGTLFFGVLSVLVFAIFLIRRIKERNNPPFEDADEDLLDGHYNQVIVMSSSRSLVDF
jgi:hypothetical protein